MSFFELSWRVWILRLLFCYSLFIECLVETRDSLLFCLCLFCFVYSFRRSEGGAYFLFKCICG